MTAEAAPEFGWSVDRVTDLEHRVQVLERRMARFDYRPAESMVFTACGVCGVFSVDGICPRADCPRGQVIYPPPEHEAS